MKIDSSSPLDSSASRETLLTEIERLRQELSKANLNSELNPDQYGWLFRNLPLGAQEEDYSSIKIEVDKIISRGVDNIADYFLNNPELLRQLVTGVKVTGHNRSQLEIFWAETTK